MGQGHIARSAAQFPGDLAIESVEYAAAQVVAVNQLSDKERRIGK